MMNNKDKKTIKPAPKKIDLKHTGHVSTGSKITKSSVVNLDSKNQFIVQHHQSIKFKIKKIKI